MVALVSSSGAQFCGGTLVASKYVVTAAHCTTGITTPGKFVVVLGEWDRDLDFDTFISAHNVSSSLLYRAAHLQSLTLTRWWREYRILSMTPRLMRMTLPSGDSRLPLTLITSNPSVYQIQVT